jgi:hypothetical protein
MDRAVALAVVTLAACSVPLSSARPVTADPERDAHLTATWDQQIRSVARDGDWILAAAGDDLSHAALYDAERDTIIEAEGAEIREVPLIHLLEVARYVVVVRPSRMSEADRAASVARARGRLGVLIDVGVAGPDDQRGPALVYWASQTEARAGAHEAVLTPGVLVKYGEVIFASPQRDALD